MKEKVKNFLASKKMKVAMICSAMASALAIGVSADDPVTSATISSTMQTAMQSTITETMNMLSAILPAAFGLVGAMIVVSFGIKLFKKVTGKA